MQEHPAVDDLADKSHADSIKEMHQAARLFAGIILLDGHPNLKTLDAEHAARTLCTEARRQGGIIPVITAIRHMAPLSGESAGPILPSVSSRAIVLGPAPAERD